MRGQQLTPSRLAVIAGGLLGVIDHLDPPRGDVVGRVWSFWPMARWESFMVLVMGGVLGLGRRVGAGVPPDVASRLDALGMQVTPENWASSRNVETSP